MNNVEPIRRRVAADKQDNVGDKTLKTMTVKEVAEVLGVHYDTVASRVKQMFPEIVRNGVTTYLDEIQVTAIKLDIQNSQPANLRNAPKVQEAKTNLEKALIVQQALILQQEMIDALQKDNEEKTQQLAIAAPKVELHDRFLSAPNSMSMGVVAKELFDGKIGRNKFFQMLRQDGILMNDNVPRQMYMDKGYFKVINISIRIGIDSIGNDIYKNEPTTYVTATGQKFLSEKYPQFSKKLLEMKKH